MMSYRDIKAALVELLGDEAAGRFRVLGYRGQNKGAPAVEGQNRLVQVYYSEGDFPRSGRMRGPKTHDITIDIDITASAVAEGDISVLENPASTAHQKAAALLALHTASEMVDESIDEVIDAVYNIIMDARNADLNLPVGDVASRWVPRIQKDQVLERGELVVKTANLRYTCRVQEYVQGDIGNVPDRVIYDAGMTGDIPASGVLVDNDNTGG